jgi:alpha-D-ribose 1-methylphosphonate 5-phosphate C-P lyase
MDDLTNSEKTEKNPNYNFAFLDEASKREIRRAILHAIAAPGYQVPFGSRELPIGRGWGTGGMQITMSVIGPEDVLKVIDQGSDDSVNAISIRRLIKETTGVRTTTDTAEASIIQSRHRVPEEPLRTDQVLVLQVPSPEPLRGVDSHEAVTRALHGDAEYTGIWVRLFERLLLTGNALMGADHPVFADKRYLMNPSPIPRHDNPKLHQSECLYLFGAGREKKIYAVPPHTDIQSLAFEDYPFRTEDMGGRVCRFCGATGVYFDEFFDAVTGERQYQCSDLGYCVKRRKRLGEEVI